ncbi:MAG: hypothetical protein IPO27_00695 [Bacteroidetes bacterium]|nr:hypothetical protein [Bacteroidota bacterium]
MKNILIACLAISMLASCKNPFSLNETESTSKIKIAQVHDFALYTDEILKVLPEKLSPADSIKFLKAYVDNWTREKVLLHKASQGEDASNETIEKQVEEYRKSLILYNYERTVVLRMLDTIVTDDAIQEYYDNNQANFQLKENITRCLYARFPRNVKNLQKFKQWLMSNDENSRQQVDNFCFQHATDYFLNDDVWMPFTDIMMRTGIKTYNQEQFLQYTKVIDIPDSNSNMVVKFFDFKIKESMSPLSFETENIKTLS